MMKAFFPRLLNMAALGMLVFSSLRVCAQINVPPLELQKVDIVEHLGGQLPLNTTFRTHEGTLVRLIDVFDAKRPRLLVLSYHTCPMLCSLVLDGLTKGLKSTPWTVGQEFDVISISIDPRDTPESAARKRTQLISSYGRPNTDKGWHFLVGDEHAIRRVTDAVGFGFRFDEKRQEYAHPAAVFLLTPTGSLARYLYGIEFKPNDLRFGLLEASESRTISTVEKLLLYCFHYDPQGQRYALVAKNAMRIGGGLTVLLIGGLLGTLSILERRKKPPTS